MVIVRTPSVLIFASYRISPHFRSSNALPDWRGGVNGTRRNYVPGREKLSHKDVVHTTNTRPETNSTPFHENIKSVVRTSKGARQEKQQQHVGVHILRRRGHMKCDRPGNARRLALSKQESNGENWVHARCARSMS